MSTFVVTDSHQGSIDRYEGAYPQVRRTHGACYGEPVQFSPEFVYKFRTDPPEEFRVEPPPRPTNSPAGAGSVPPCDVERAA